MYRMCVYFCRVRLGVFSNRVLAWVSNGWMSDFSELLIHLHYALFFSLAIQGGSVEGGSDFLIGPVNESCGSAK